jgi:hypothetical protein
MILFIFYKDYTHFFKAMSSFFALFFPFCHRNNSALLCRNGAKIHQIFGENGELINNIKSRFHFRAVLARKKPLNRINLRLFQNFSFWNSYHKSIGKSGL